MIYIPSFEACNFSSFNRFLKVRGLGWKNLTESTILNPSMDCIFLPGVGSFSEGMGCLARLNLVALIRDFAKKGGVVVGVCLGMQLMLEGSEESPGVEGLSLLKGFCKLLPNDQHSKVPRVGWDEITVRKPGVIFGKSDLVTVNLNYFKSKSDYYFVHSFYCDPFDSSVETGFFYHAGQKYCASFECGNILGMQFHPEKSGDAGYLILDSIFSRAIKVR